MFLKKKTDCFFKNIFFVVFNYFYLFLEGYFLNKLYKYEK